MSNSKGAAFEQWIVDRFADTGGFTALILLLSIQDGKIQPISCSFVHVIGDEVRWKDMRAMLDMSRRQWDGFVVFPESAPGGGPLVDFVAKARLQERIDEVTMDRMVLNSGGLFDKQGRAFRVDPVELN